MKTLIVIPARYASTRYPGKALVPLRGATGVTKPLIQRSWEAAQEVQGIDRVVVATDDGRISDVAQGFGAEVVNLQGDAPLTPHWFIEDLVAGLMAHPTAEVATPVLRADGRALMGFQEDRRAGRVGGTTVVFGAEGKALYFSKEVIPYTDGLETSPNSPTSVFHHVGVYAYRPSALAAYPRWTPGPLETLEGLEQLRFLERERPVQCIEVDAKGRQFWELNNPEDVPRIEEMLRGMGVE